MCTASSGLRQSCRSGRTTCSSDPAHFQVSLCWLYHSWNVQGSVLRIGCLPSIGFVQPKAVSSPREKQLSSRTNVSQAPCDCILKTQCTLKFPPMRKRRRLQPMVEIKPEPSTLRGSAVRCCQRGQTLKKRRTLNVVDFEVSLVEERCGANDVLAGLVLARGSASVPDVLVSSPVSTELQTKVYE